MENKDIEKIINFVEKKINGFMSHNPKIIFLSDLEEKLKNLINKPVETTNEQLKCDGECNCKDCKSSRCCV